MHLDSNRRLAVPFPTGRGLWPGLVCGLFVILAAAPGAELVFSHQLHLGKVGLSCAVCHASTEGSESAADNNLPEAALCLACHNGQVAPQIDVTPLADRTPADRNFHFSHKQHLVLEDPAARIAEAIDTGKYLGAVPDIRELLEGADSCGACHRGLSEAAKVDSTIHLPRMSDCLVCHDQIDNPFSCEQCHPADVQIRPDDHTREFIDGHSTGKLGFNKLTCQPCHGVGFRCMGCH